MQNDYISPEVLWALDVYGAERLFRNEKGFLFAEIDRGTKLMCGRICPDIGCGETVERNGAVMDGGRNNA